MPVFVVIAQRGRDEIAERVEALGNDNVFSLTNDSWLVSFDGTTQACAETLTVRGDEANENDRTGIVFKASNYSGRFNTNVWEWLKIKQGRGES